MRSVTIAIDFDGTCVTHEFPKIGRDIGAAPILKELVNSGHKLILFTMRSNVISPISEDPKIHSVSGKYLDEAIAWFKRNKIELYGIQTNPTQRSWTLSPKAYAELYIDDAALGCPLIQDYIEHPDGLYNGEPIPDGRPYVDWGIVKRHLQFRGLLK